MKRTKRILALILAFAMMLGSTSITAWADTGEATPPNNVSTESFGDSNTVAWTYEGKEGVEYATTLSAALTAAYMANKEGKQITIYCKPNADVGSMLHGHVEDNLVIYGNGAFVSGGEQDLEVDQYTFSRETGENTGKGPSFTKDVKIEVYNLGGIAIWGTRQSGYSLTAKFYNCSNMQRAYINGATGPNYLYFEGCSFDASENAQLKANQGTTIYSNASGSIEAVGCTFNEIYAAFNLNNKSTGKQTVKVTNCVFTNCGTNETKDGVNTYCAPVRVCVTKSANASTDLTVKNCTFSGTIGTNGDVLLGEGRTGKDNFQTVSLNMSGTSATAQLQSPGIAASTESNTLSQATADQTMKTNDEKNAFVVTTPAPVAQNFYVDAENENLYHIANLAGLIEFRDSVNNGTNYSGKTIQLDADIDLSEDVDGNDQQISWVPIGVNSTNAQPYKTSSATSFKGVFDGKDHTISNLYINDSNLVGAGLFAVALDGEIKDLNLYNVSIKARSFIGSVVGFSYSVISDCDVFGKIHISGHYMQGGIVGQSYVNISGCDVNGGNKANSYITATYQENDYEADKIGGIVGHWADGSVVTISNCSVQNIKIAGTRQVGGMIGHGREYCTYTGCSVSDVVIVANTPVDYAASKSAKIAFGGFIGDVRDVANTGRVENITISNIDLQIVNEAVKQYAKMGFVSGGVYGKSFDEALPTIAYSNINVSGTNTSQGSLSCDAVLVQAPVPVTYVAQIGDAKYETLQAAVAAAQSGDTITLLADIALDKDIHVTTSGELIYCVLVDGVYKYQINAPQLSSLTIDGDGHTISMANNAAFGSKYRLTDGCAFFFGKYGEDYGKTGTVEGNYTIKNVTFTGFDTEIIRSGNATVNLVNCTFSENHITKGVVQTGNDSAADTSMIYAYQGALNVQGCTFVGNTTSMDKYGLIFSNNSNTAATITINNSLFENNGTAQNPTLANGLIYLSNAASSEDAITNNTFIGNYIKNTSNNAAVVYLSKPVETFSGNLFSGNHVEVTVSDKKEAVIVLGSSASGTPVTGNAFVSNVLGETPQRRGTIVVGCNSDLSNNYWGDGAAAERGTGLDIYVDGDKLITNTNYATAYTANTAPANGVTVTLPSYVAEIGGTKYETLADAIAAANDTQSAVTIKLLDNCDTGAAKIDNPLVLTNAGATLDLDGKTITVNNNFSFVLQGNNIEVKNGSLISASNADKRTGWNSYILVVNDCDGVKLTGLTMQGGISIGGSQSDWGTTAAPNAGITYQHGADKATNVTIANCNVTSGDYYAVCSQMGSDATIVSGTYVSNQNVVNSTVGQKSPAVIYGRFTNDDGPEGYIYVTGGNFNGTIGTVNKDWIVISGGYFTDEPESGLIKTGYMAISNLDSETSTAYPFMVAKVESAVNDTTSTTNEHVAVQEITYTDSTGNEATAVAVTDKSGKTEVVVTTSEVDSSVTSSATAKASDYVEVAQVLANFIETNSVSVANVTSIDMTLSLSKNVPENDATATAILNAVTEEGTKKVFELHPVATVTIDNGTPVSYDVSNSELAKNATFTTKLRFPGAAYKNVTLTHYASDGSVKNTWVAMADKYGDVTITLSSFSYVLGVVDANTDLVFAVDNNDNWDAYNFISNTYLNVQDQLYFTVQFHVSTLLGSNWKLRFTFADGDYVDYADYAASNFINTKYNEQDMKVTMAQGGRYTCDYRDENDNIYSNVYEIRQSIYPSNMDKVIKVEILNNEGTAQTLYVRGSGNNLYRSTSHPTNFSVTTNSYLTELAGNSSWTTLANTLKAFGAAAAAKFGN